MSDIPFSSDRRDFLTGKSVRDRIGERLAESASRQAPSAGNTLRLTQRAMACDFSVIMNAGASKDSVENASAALEFITDLEKQMSVYIDDSEMTLLNQNAYTQPVEIEAKLFELLCEANRLSEQTDRAFDPTSGPLVALWRACRQESRIPTQEEIDTCLANVGMEHVQFDAETNSVHFDNPAVELNLGAIGKGYALDRAADAMLESGVDQFLLHGGHSSLLARGDHNGSGGWPVGIGNPLFTGKRLGTIVISDCAMATSGSNIQYFRHQGRKYGHILNPRTGWPVETMLSVTVLAPTAAMADALSTAFYVMGVEKVAECCDNLGGVSAILIPAPSGRDLQPIVLGVPDEKLFLDQDQIVR